MEYKIKDSFIVKKPYHNVDFANKSVHLEPDTEVYRLQECPNYLCYLKNGNLIPFCIYRSQNAKDYLVWNNESDERWNLEQEIFQLAPFSEELMAEIRDKFKHLIREDCSDTIIYNDYFYIGSHISELKQYRDWLQSKVIK